MKKILIGLTTALTLSAGTVNVQAMVDFPSTTSFASTGYLKLIEGQNLAWTKTSANTIALVDLESGEKLQSITSSTSDIGKHYAVSDDQKLVAIIENTSIKIYDEFAEMVQQIDSIPNKNETLSIFYYLEFLPNSHTLIGMSNKGADGKLFGYDLDQKSITFSRGTNHFGRILTSNDTIAVINSNDAYFYGHDGTYKTVIHPEDGKIEVFDFNRDGLLALGENGSPQLKVYDGKQDFKKLHTSNTFMTNAKSDFGKIDFKDIDIDESGQFIAATYYNYSEKFSMFERSGRTIHTSLDRNSKVNRNSTVKLTNGAQKILLRSNNGNINVFDGRNVIKRPVAINILKEHQEVMTGTSEELSIELTQADGKKVKVKDGVTWAINAPTKAYLKSNQLVGKSVGTYTLKATYEGFTTSVTGKVVAPPKLSSLKDVPWLQRHRQSILTNKAFEGTVAPESSYKKISGVAGKMYIPKTNEMWNGKWSGNTLYARSASYDGNGADQIDLVVLLPALEKRTLTKTEIKTAFGKATKTYNYQKPFTYYLDKSKKNFAKYTISNASVYHVNGQYLYIAFDKNDYARIFALSSLN
ncbi:hypothetical protein [Exiguobacterium sp. s138]|uniref:hypothetical protein n=1 Tax=Exiguobacterium sp. s138 TaxID=2751202 RepID=UPI001BE627D4|nr:hypothetical protein [Exiguobacterium sp. s138]